MKRTFAAVAAALLTATLVPAASAAPSSPQTATATATATAGSDIIVTLKPGADLHALTSDLNVTNRYRKVFKGFAAHVTTSQLEGLQNDPAVLAVEPNVRVFTNDVEVNPPWGLDRVDQRSGRDGTYTYDTTGAGVTAYVVDTGIRATHSDFTGRVLQGVDLVDSDGDPADCNGHGTHVSGTIAGSTFGVAKQVSIVPVRALDCSGGGRLADILAAFDWVIAAHAAGTPAVLNYSVGCNCVSSLLDAAARAVIADGVSFQAAAGNEASDACFSSPGRVAGVNTIGASDSGDSMPHFSDYGPCVDVVAPGVDVTSDWIDSDTSTNMLSGTSMATPHVTGEAARFLQENPTATPAMVSEFLVSQSTKGAVTNPDLGDTYDLLFAPSVGGTPPPPPPPPPPVVSLPSAPYSVHAYAGKRRATITWHAPSRTGSAAIDKYQVHRLGSNRFTAPFVHRVTFLRLRPATYAFTVRAHNKYGWGPFSAPRRVHPR